MKLVNEFGVINHCTQAGFALEAVQDEISKGIKEMVEKFELDSLDLIMLEHHLIAQITADCAVERLLYGIAARKKAREKAGQQDTKAVS